MFENSKIETDLGNIDAILDTVENTDTLSVIEGRLDLLKEAPREKTVECCKNINVILKEKFSELHIDSKKLFSTIPNIVG